MNKDRSGAEDDDHWQTPQWLYDQLDAEFHFNFDPCPIHANFDGLALSWGTSNFINPPYNRKDKPKFIQKAFDEWKQGKTCVLLIPSATGTEQFHDLILPNAEIRFLRGRVTFVPPGLPRNATEKQIREFNKQTGGGSEKHQRKTRFNDCYFQRKKRMKPEWKDVTGYSRDDKERKPETFELREGDLRIVITCGHIYHSPAWVMHCGALSIDTKRLQATTREEAQAEAIAVVKERLAKLTANFYQIKGAGK